MIKVLMVGNHPSNKGGMTSVIEQIRGYRWEKDGIEMSFVPTYMPGNLFKKVVFFFVSYIRIMVRFIISKPDIVHMHMSYKGSFDRKYRVHRLCNLFGIKDIVHLHGSEFESWADTVGHKKKNQIGRLFSECSAIIVLGEKAKSTILKIEPSAKVEVIHNGISIPNDTVRWNEEKCQVLYLGVLILRKGVSDLIKAISLIRENGKIERFHFVIAGTGEEEKNLKQQVTDESLDNYVSFAGWVTGEKKNELIKNSQILVSPSYHEGLPISILEASSYGMPVISTDVGEISSIIKDHVNGILIRPGDTEALADSIAEVASKDLYARMSEESRRITKEEFSIEVFYDKLSMLYHRIGGRDD